MKRICICLIALCILCTSAALNLSAESASITDAEAAKLVRSAINVHDITCVTWTLNDGGGTWWKIYYLSVDPNKLIGGSLEGFREHINTIYAPGEADEYWSANFFFPGEPRFIEDEQGTLYITFPVPQRYPFYYGEIDEIKVELIESNSKTARAKVYVGITDLSVEDLDFPVYDAWVECKFENTADGWRISDCAFFDMLLSSDRNFEWTAVDSPDTGDTVTEKTFILLLLPLACLLPAVCITRRRKIFAKQKFFN